MYVFIVGHPGTGKTRTIWDGRDYVSKLAEPMFAPVSITFASLVDSLKRSKRTLIRLPDDPIEYNTMFICVDELGAFMHKYDTEMYKGLAAFYDPVPYSQERRGRPDDKIKIGSPQLNILCGTTPTDLLKMMPEEAWGQGFSARLILVFSDERIIGDDFAVQAETKSPELQHDLEIINGLVGEFHVTPEYKVRVKQWRDIGEPPIPNHPKLIHYITRRKMHLYKLSMVSSVDRDNGLVLTVEDFNRAYNWLCEAEAQMPEIFLAGTVNADAQAMDEIGHFVMINDKGHGVSEQRITHFAKDKIPIYSILRVVDIMERTGMIKCIGTDRNSKLRYFSPGR